MVKNSLKQIGFTIVEITIVIAVIAILAAISFIAYGRARESSRDSQYSSDILYVQSLIQAYHEQNGEYPITTSNTEANWRAIDVLTDDNCPNGSSQANWVPNLSVTLPQSNQAGATGVGGQHGCYLYASNGSQYVLSAWNMLNTPQSTTLYRRLGFRAFQSDNSTLFYTCNDNVVGGANSGYDITSDYYKHSYTVSNITSADCNETPPPGA